MDIKKTGEFISELRKSKQLTQKELAAKLNITDKAVSKWERGLSYPDISFLPILADIFGVTTSELLSGERCASPSENVEVSIDNALHYADRSAERKLKSLQSISALVFSLLLLAGIFVCAICDLAISGAFTWSLYPISSIVFAWLVLFPVLKFGTKGIAAALTAVSVLIVPFLSILNELIGSSNLILPIGTRMAFVSAVYLWSVFALFKLFKKRKFLAGAISLLLVIPAEFLINFILSRIISEPLIDIWDMIVFSLAAAGAIILIFLDNKRNSKAI